MDHKDLKVIREILGNRDQKEIREIKVIRETLSLMMTLLLNN